MRTNNVQGRTNREIKRRSRAVQALPSEASPANLVGAVMSEQDEGWSESRYFSERRIVERRKDGPKPEPPTGERGVEPGLVAEQAIKASLGLANGMEAT